MAKKSEPMRGAVRTVLAEKKKAGNPSRGKRASLNQTIDAILHTRVSQLETTMQTVAQRSVNSKEAIAVLEERIDDLQERFSKLSLDSSGGAVLLPYKVKIIVETEVNARSDRDAVHSAADMARDIQKEYVADGFECVTHVEHVALK